MLRIGNVSSDPVEISLYCSDEKGKLVSAKQLEEKDTEKMEKDGSRKKVREHNQNRPSALRKSIKRKNIKDISNKY